MNDSLQSSSNHWSRRRRRGPNFFILRLVGAAVLSEEESLHGFGSSVSGRHAYVDGLRSQKERSVKEKDDSTSSVCPCLGSVPSVQLPAVLTPSMWSSYGTKIVSLLGTRLGRRKKTPPSSTLAVSAFHGERRQPTPERLRLSWLRAFCSIVSDAGYPF